MPRSLGFGFALLVVLTATSSAQTAFIVRDVRVFDGDEAREHRSVLVDSGRILQVAGPDLLVRGATVIDGRGRTLVPGFFDAHVHLPNDVKAAARQALVLGVTTQLDMFTGGERLQQIKRLESEDPVDVADVRTAGIGATVPGGHPTQMGGGPIPTITEPGQAAAFVAARIAEGSDYIKIIHDDGSTWAWTTQRVPMLDTATMRALVDAAHRRGKLAVIHALSESQARDAIAAGADGLAHLFLGDSVSASFAEFAAQHHVFIIPTLSTDYLACGKSEGPELFADPRLAPYIGATWRRGLKMAKPEPANNHFCKGTDAAIGELVRAHVALLVGTDAPAPGATYGASVHGEMALLVHDGLTPLEALAAATSAPARAFRLSDRGLIRVGMRADLVLVDGDPTRDILATRNIVAVWKRGVLVQR